MDCNRLQLHSSYLRTPDNAVCPDSVSEAKQTLEEEIHGLMIMQESSLEKTPGRKAFILYTQ